MSEQNLPHPEEWASGPSRIDARNESIRQAVLTAAMSEGIGLHPVGEAAIWSEVSAIVDRLKDFDGELPEGLAAYMAGALASHILESPLHLKLLTAMMYENCVNDNEIADGILGQAVDRAIEVMRPYYEATGKRHVEKITGRAS